MATPSLNPFPMPTRFMGPGIPRALMPARMIPSFNVTKAFENGTAKNFVINTWGGLGDQISAEPAVRFGLSVFKKTDISLASNCPSLYSHLKFKEVFDTRKVTPDWDKYLVFNTILPPDHLLWEFVTHMLTHCVDFPSICMWRCQLPVADREIQLPDFPVTANIAEAMSDPENTVVVHAGKHWQSKTFPKIWWDQTIHAFKLAGFKIVLIGHEVDKNVGFVDVNPEGCIDLRNRLTIPEFVTVLKGCRYLFSNDSSPIHAAAAGDAFIGMVASCKHPDFITHWRKGQFGYKTKNFGLDGIWNHIDYSPAQTENIEAEQLPGGLMDRILPEPTDVALYYKALKEGATC